MTMNNCDGCKGWERLYQELKDENVLICKTLDQVRVELEQRRAILAEVFRLARE